MHWFHSYTEVLNFGWIGKFYCAYVQSVCKTWQLAFAACCGHSSRPVSWWTLLAVPSAPRPTLTSFPDHSRRFFGWRFVVDSSIPVDSWRNLGRKNQVCKDFIFLMFYLKWYYQVTWYYDIEKATKDFCCQQCRHLLHCAELFWWDSTFYCYSSCTFNDSKVVSLRSCYKNIELHFCRNAKGALTFIRYRVICNVMCF